MRGSRSLHDLNWGLAETALPALALAQAPSNRQSCRQSLGRIRRLRDGGGGTLPGLQCSCCGTTVGERPFDSIRKASRSPVVAA